ncbi:MAG: hypothetical protein INR68_10125 [Methylobacterium mesophilicum]|nr:hypothetical protein [Methylobacterium mesophilicum]
MADFVAVLRKTLAGMGETTPAMRARVYDKARNTIEAKLAALNPPPPEAAAARQRKTLEDAITLVERDYAPPPPAAPPPAPRSADPLDELDDVFSSINAQRQTPSSRATPAAPRPAPPVASRAPEPPRPAPSQPAAAAPRAFVPSRLQTEPRPQPEARQFEARHPEPRNEERQEPRGYEPAPQRHAPQPSAVPPQPQFPQPGSYAPAPVAAPAPRRDPDEFDLEDHAPRAPDDTFGRREPEVEAWPGNDWRGDEEPQDEWRDHEWPSEELPPHEDDEPRRGRGGLIAAGVALLLLAGGGYAAWTNRDTIGPMIGLNPSGQPAATQTTAEEPAQQAPATGTPDQNGSAADSTDEEEPASSDQAAVEDGTNAGDDAPAQAAAGPEAAASNPARTQKFTQRLSADGRETDPGAGGAAGTVGEGTSVAALSGAGATAVTTGATQQTAQAGETGNPSPAAVAVGQRAIFYEERTNVSQSSAEQGSIVWSLVRESPGGDQPPEPAIRAEATVPGKNIQLRMTIRRNADRTLPASHIVEMIFLTPDNFEGGGIENVLRMTMKNSEQETGAPLSGIPAKIADGYFLVALSDNAQDTQANLNLLRTRSWIDVPIVYKSGRRALITLEKGVPGDKVFQDAINAWGGPAR